MTDARKTRDRRTFRFEPRHMDYHRKANGSFKDKGRSHKGKQWFEEK